MAGENGPLSDASNHSMAGENGRRSDITNN
jgi:hypothetical protein